MQEFIKYCKDGEIEYNERNNEVIITIKDLKIKFVKEKSCYVHISYTEEELNELIKKCNFNEDNGEIDVLKLWNKGKTYLSMSLDLNMSTATISRRVKSIKNKISLIEK